MPTNTYQITPVTGASQQTPGSGLDERQKWTIASHALGDLRRLRYYRRQFDQRRFYFYRQYLGQRDQRFYPDNVTPRSNLFVPYSYANVETIVARVLDVFFSMDEWFEVRPRNEASTQAAIAMQQVLHYMLHKANVEHALEDFIRNVVMYGHSALKVEWDFGFDTLTLPQPVYLTDNQGQVVLNPQTGQPVIRGTQMQSVPVPRNCPKFKAVDIYDVLVDPDHFVIADLADKTWATMKREYEANPELYFPEGMAQLASILERYPKPDEVIIRLAEIWDSVNNTWTIMTFGEDYDTLAWKDLRASLRAMTYSPWRRNVYSGDVILLWHSPNPFLHKRSPILDTSFVKLPNEVYGLGEIEILSDLNEAMNRQVNMIVDNWNLGINKRFAYDVNMDIDHEALNNFNVPGGKVGVSGDPSKVLFPIPQFTPTEQDYQVLPLMQDMIQLVSGIGDFYSRGSGEPQGQPGASGIQQIMNESNTRLRMFIRNVETEILQPLLEMCASMVQQYVTDPIEIEITNAPPGIPKLPIVKPEELVGLFSFDIVSANYAANKFVRQRNMLALSNLLANSPYINEYEATKELLKVFEIEAPARFLKPPQQVQQEQQQAMQNALAEKVLDSVLKTEQQSHVAVVKNATKPQGGAGGKEGRPRKVQLEGKIPGAGATSMVKEVAQAMGANAHGLEGLTELFGEGKPENG